ncbi:hypothetical protein D3C72_2183050 [compost metagenome]
MSGFSAVIGSWKIMAMRLPRSVCSSSRPACVMSRPASRIWPLSRVSTPLGNKPMTALDVTDLPEPDSPTMHTISRAWTVNDTSSTA